MATFLLIITYCIAFHTN